MLLPVTPATVTKYGALAVILLPKIDVLFPLLKGEKYFTALDLCSGYYHIKLDEEFIPKSVFTALFGKFKFLRLPFSFSQGQDFFIWLIYDLFRPYKTSNQGQGSGYLAYLDILIYNKTEKEHRKMIEKAFKCLLKVGLKIKLNSCSFFKEQIHYLGHLVSGTSILSLADKIEALMKLKPPTNIMEVRHFLRLTGYYQKFICNYVHIAHPLHCLMHKSQPFVWSPECQSSFDMLCSQLANAPIAQLSNPNKPYLLFTDVSKFCYSGVLTHESTKDSK